MRRAVSGVMAVQGFPIILFAIVFVRQTSGLYFLIGETEKKCFVEEVPDQTMVMGHYKMSVFDSQTKTYKQMPQLGMHVEVTDPENQVILSRLYTNEGKFTFTSSKPGEHVICMFSNSSRWMSGSMLKVDFNIQVGDHAQDYAQIATKERLNDLQLRLRQLMDQVGQMAKEQNYQRYREEMFRELSESTNQRVLWWAIAQTAVLVLTGMWQMRHLKGFFEAKKLV